MVSAGVGRGFDRFLANYFSHRGYLAVKSAGSKGLADVVAIPVHPGGKILLVQAKAGDVHRITPREWNGLYQMVQSNPCVTALAAFRSESGPVFYELCNELLLNTRTEKLPWRPWTIPHLAGQPT